MRTSPKGGFGRFCQVYFTPGYIYTYIQYVQQLKQFNYFNFYTYCTVAYTDKCTIPEDLLLFV